MPYPEKSSFLNHIKKNFYELHKAQLNQYKIDENGHHYVEDLPKATVIKHKPYFSDNFRYRDTDESSLNHPLHHPSSQSQTNSNNFLEHSSASTNNLDGNEEESAVPGGGPPVGEVRPTPKNSSDKQIQDNFKSSTFVYDNYDHFEPLDQTSREYILAEKCILARIRQETKDKFVYNNTRFISENNPGYNSKHANFDSKNKIAEVKNSSLIDKKLNITNTLDHEIDQICSRYDLKKNQISYRKIRNLSYVMRINRTYPAVDYAIIFEDNILPEICMKIFNELDLQMVYESKEKVTSQTRYWR